MHEDERATSFPGRRARPGKTSLRRSGVCLLRKNRRRRRSGLDGRLSLGGVAP